MDNANTIFDNYRDRLINLGQMTDESKKMMNDFVMYIATDSYALLLLKEKLLQYPDIYWELCKRGNIYWTEKIRRILYFLVFGEDIYEMRRHNRFWVSVKKPTPLVR